MDSSTALNNREALSTLEIARAYHDAGLCVIAVRADGSKAPAISSWKRYTAERPADADLDRMFARRKVGIAVVGGAVSGNLECLDFDQAAEIIFPEWCALVEEECPGLVAQLSVAQTPKPGYHVRYRCPETEIPGNTKLASDPSKPGKEQTLIETRGTAGYALVPGCPPECHETGRLYLHHSGPPLTRLSTITAAEREILIRCARSFDRGQQEPERPHNGNGCDLRPGDDFNARGPTWAEILEPHGISRARESGPATYWLRDGKDKGWSATTGYCQSKAGHDLLAVFSSNMAPFQGPTNGKSCTTYTKFAAYTLLNHGGDFKAAAKALGQQGYGEQRHRGNGRPHAEANGDGRHQEIGSRDEGDEQAASGPWLLTNYREIKEQVGEGENAKEVTVKVGLSAAAIGEEMRRQTGGWPKRVGPALFVEGPEYHPLWLQSTDQLFAWGARQCRLETLNPVRWATGTDKVSQAQEYASLTQTAEDFAAVAPFPHWPLLPRYYYMHPQPEGGDGKHLGGLLERFEPATPIDWDLIFALFLTLFWGGAAGQRPAFLVEADHDDNQSGRGAGKTTLIRCAAHLVGGHIDLRPGEDITRLIGRLLSPVALEQRLALLDNIKTLRFSWADLEALITNDVISGHQWYVGEARRPNTLVWCLTLNKANLSKDMAQRCVIIQVKRPKRNASWEQEVWTYIDTHRWEIIGDILAELQKPVEPLRRYSRWSTWEQGVLAHVGEPSDCQKVIAERQDAVDGDQEESDLVRQALVDLLKRWRHDPDTGLVWISSATAAEETAKATGVAKGSEKMSAYLNTLSIQELRKSNRGDWGRGWLWRGLKTPLTATAKKLTDPDG